MRNSRIRIFTVTAALGLLAASVALAANASAADDVVESATTDGTPVQIATSSAGQQAHVLFDATPGRLLTVSCEPGTGASSYVIQRADGSEFTRNTCDPNKPLKFDPILESGRLRMLFTSAGDQGFSATVRVLAGEEIKGDIVPDGPGLVLQSTKLDQNLVYSLPMRPGQRVQLLCFSDAPLIKILMLDPSGQVVPENFGASNTCASSFREAEDGMFSSGLPGTYRFVVSPGPRLHNYYASLRVVTTTPDETAELATDGTPATLAIKTPYQRAQVTFRLSATTQVRITCATTSTGSTWARTYRDGILQSSYPCKQGGSGPAPVILNSQLRKGTWTIVVDPDGVNTGDVTVAAQAIPAQ